MGGLSLSIGSHTPETDFSLRVSLQLSREPGNVLAGDVPGPLSCGHQGWANRKSSPSWVGTKYHACLWCSNHWKCRLGRFLVKSRGVPELSYANQGRAGLIPVEPSELFNSAGVIAKQAPDHAPSATLHELDVTLWVDANFA